jgi:hypothetical protein
MISLAVLGTMGFTLFCVFAVRYRPHFPLHMRAYVRGNNATTLVCLTSPCSRPLQIGEPLVTMAAVALQSACLFWYTISYIPFMRACLKTTAGKCFGALLEDEF